MNKNLKEQTTQKKKMDERTKKLQSLKKQELVELCKEQNINCYGTKLDMIQRLLSCEKGGVISKIKHEIKPIIIKKISGRYIHEPTGLVFDEEERVVIGKLTPTGMIDLDYKDIQTCLLYKFRYILPENLTTNIQVVDKLEDERLKERLHSIETTTNQNDDDDDEDEL